MSIRRWTSSKDTTITDAFTANLRTRGTGSNMGASDILEVFSIYAQASTSSLSSSEVARVLTQFPVNNIVSDRTAGKIPVSGNVNFVLKMFNAPHSQTLPRQFTLNVLPVSTSWEEGIGLDMEEYTDLTNNGEGANWVFAGSSSLWTTHGGDFISSPSASQFFDQGIEDLEIDITPVVERWIAGTIPNYGIGIMITGSQETTNRSFYTKRFFARGSEFFFSRPVVEARWNSATTDDRGRFFVSNVLLSPSDNTHTLYLYNYVNGQLKNINGIGTGSVYMNVYDSASDGSIISTTSSPVTGGYVSTGIYSASFILNELVDTAYDIWFSGANVYHTGSFTPQTYDASDYHSDTRKFVSAITNLKQSYNTKESARIRLFSRLRDWNPNIVSIASTDLQGTIIENAFYKVLRTNDDYVIVDYGTGSLNHTKLSYDSKGNFFDFDMSMLEPGFSYTFKFVFLVDNNYEEQTESFKFRVEG